MALVLEAIKDTTLIILITAAIVSLALSFYPMDHKGNDFFSLYVKLYNFNNSKSNAIFTQTFKLKIIAMQKPNGLRALQFSLRLLSLF